MEWIKVEDQLPIKYGFIIISNGIQTSISIWDNGFEFVGLPYLGQITHWMDLPESPKEK